MDNNNENATKPAKKVLVIVDMQNDFLTGSLGGKHCREAIPECVRLIEDGGWDAIFLTEDTHGKDYLNTLEGEKLPVVHCKKGSAGHAVCQEVREAIDSVKQSIARGFVVERRKDTFGDITLKDKIRKLFFGFNPLDRYYDVHDKDWLYMVDLTGCYTRELEFHICGVCTSICVLANAVILRAYYPNARIVIHAKACGDVNEEMHRHALACLRAQQCDIED